MFLTDRTVYLLFVWWSSWCGWCNTLTFVLGVLLDLTKQTQIPLLLFVALFVLGVLLDLTKQTQIFLLLFVALLAWRHYQYGQKAVR